MSAEPDSRVATDVTRVVHDRSASTRIDNRPTRRRRKRPSQRRFWLRRLMVLGVASLVVGVAWLAVSAVQARGALTRAKLATAVLRTELSSGDTERAAERVTAIRQDTARARKLTSSPVWRVASRAPLAGDTARTVRGLAREADVLAERVLPHLVEVARATSGGALRNGDKIDIAALRTIHREISAASIELDGVVQRAQELPTGPVLTAVAAGRTALIDDATGLSHTAVTLRDATSIAPSMLGGDGVRRYFVGLQTNAEMRGSGGLLGAYAILEADDGKIRLVALGPNTELKDTYPATTPGLPDEFAQRYGAFGADGLWLNANMSGHFPTVSAIWSSMYERTTGVRIDGSIAVDPVAMAEILKATGPATGADGEVISGENIVALSEQQIYSRYPALAQDAVRNNLQLEIARSLYARLVAPASHERALLPQLGAAASGGHVRIASNHPEEQAVLERTTVSGALPAAAAGPYLQLALNNAGGTKLDYYLRTSLSYSFETAWSDQQDVSVTVRLRNTAPASGLPEYVVIRPDLPDNRSLVPGQNRLHVSVYAGRGATLRGAALDGEPFALDAGTEQNHPVWSGFVTVDPGQERTLVLALTERGVEQAVDIVPPATVSPTSVEVLGGIRR